MSTDFSKPQLAPKPSLDQSLLLTTCHPSFLGHRQSLHLYSNSMSRGPKPPLAPKPLILTSEGRSSLYINNTLNSCANGELIYYEAHLMCQDCANVEHQCKCLELCTDNSVLESLDVDDTQKENADDTDKVLQSPIIMKGQDHDSSSIGEPVDTTLDELMAIEGYCSSDMCEAFSSKVESSSANVDEITDFDNNEQESREDFAVSTVQSPYNHIKNVSEQNTDEDFEGKDDMSIFHQHIGVNKYVVDLDSEGRELELDCLQQSAEESSSEERQLSECSAENDDILLLVSLDEETSLTHYESNEEADSRASFEEETDHYVTESNSVNDVQDKADMCCLESLSTSVGCLSEEEADGELEMTEDMSNLAEVLSDEPQKLPESDDEEFPVEKETVEAVNSENERNMEQEDNVDDGYETIEIKSEEESSEAAQDEGEVSKEDSAEKDDTLDDSCQIIPFESDCNEDLVDIPHGYLDDFLHIEHGYIHQESSVPASRVNPNCILNHNGVSECILEEESEDREEESGIHQLTYGMSSLKEGELGHHPNEDSNENSDDETKVPEKKLSKELGQNEVGAICTCIDYSADCLSLTDDEEENPYVLENSLHTRTANCFCGKRIGISRSTDSTLSQKSLRDDPSLEIDNNMLSIDLKNIVTRSRSLSGKMSGCVPETVPEETTPESEFQYTTSKPHEEVMNNHLQHLEGKHTEINRLLPAKPRRFIQYPRSYSVEGRESPISMYRETNGTSFHNNTIRGKDDNISLPCVLASSGSFSHRSQIYSSGVSTSSSGVDIPPPFELASITKKPITKSSPSLLIENDSPDKYFKKKKSSFKRFLTLKFRKKTENKIHVDVNVSSSRSSSESSYHGPSRLVDMDRRSLGGSPQLKPHSGKICACDSPSAVVLYKDGKRKGTPKSFSRNVARVESFEDRTRPPFIPLPLTKPRSISFPNADTSDYENIPAMSSDYENVQIPPRRPNRAGTFTEFFEDPSRALASASENDGYVDMSSFTTFEMKQQAPDHEAESAYTEPYKSSPAPALAAEDTVSDEDAKTSEDETNVPGPTNPGPKKEGQSRAHIIAEELLSSERVYVERLGQLHTDFYTALLKVLGDQEEDVKEESKLRKGLSTLPQICELHREILCELEDRLQNWDETQKLATVILERASSFQQHAAYIAEFDRNLGLLDESCIKSHQVASVIREYENPNWGRVSVKHQLLRVTERIFQYHMILTDYLNNLCPDSAEYEDTQAALVLVSEVADQANESMRQGENLQRLVHIEHSVRGQSNLLESGREFVKEGTLMKVSGKDRHPRHLFLMNDVLLYTYPQKDGKYRLKNTLSVAGMRVSRPVLENTQNVLRVECMDCRLLLCASSCSERDEWYCCISRTIQDYYKAHSPASYHNNVEVRERLGMCLGEKPPSLVPMSHVMMCMSCSSDFTLTLRRNHCHACGKTIHLVLPCFIPVFGRLPTELCSVRLTKIVCRNCSKKKYPLRYLKDRPAKVCDACYAELKKREMPVMIVSIPQPASSRFASSAFSSVFHSIHPSSFKKQRKIPSALMEAAASGEDSAIRGYLHRCKRGKRHWKKLWFVIKGKVLYTYTSSEDKVALESLPLLGFIVLSEKGEGKKDPGTVFQLYHKETLFYSFKAEDPSSAERWIEAMTEATVL